MLVVISYLSEHVLPGQQSGRALKADPGSGMFYLVSKAEDLKKQISLLYVG
jgi:hypothetical protein